MIAAAVRCDELSHSMVNGRVTEAAIGTLRIQICPVFFTQSF